MPELSDGSFMAMIAPCFGCKRPFMFDPETVPSIPIDPVTGLTPDLGGDAGRARREPVCRDCIELANANRRATGREEIAVRPGAYLEEE